MEIKLPKINIKYNRLIDPIFIFYCQNNPALKSRGWNDWIPPPKEKILKRVERYKKEWRKYEKKILTGIIQILGLDFKDQIIDVHVVSGNPRQISNPLIIKSGFSPTEFVDSLTHELIHRLFAINELAKIGGQLDDFIRSISKNESDTTKSHIIVHAVLKYIYLDVLNEPIRLKTSLLAAQNHSTDEYLRAWKIVEKIGYRKIISDFRNALKTALENKDVK